MTRCVPAGRWRGTPSVVLSFLLAVCAAVPQAFAQLPSPGIRDGGLLAPQIRFSQVEGETKFDFPLRIEEKWSESTKTGRTKRRSLVQVLIYRKFAIEFLLLARERMKYLGAAFGMDQREDLMSPYKLQVALASSFSKAEFPEMYENFIKGALARNIGEPISVDAVTTRAFLRHLVEESLDIVRIKSQLARVEMETRDDAKKLTQDQRTERWRDLCDLRRDQINSRPLLEENVSESDPFYLRSAQNYRMKLLLQELDMTSGDRLLHTPIDYAERFTNKKDKNSFVLNDVNGLRPEPTFFDPQHNQGILANVLTAYVLQNLKRQELVTWRPSQGWFSRSELLCKNWNEIKGKVDNLSDDVWGDIKKAFVAGLVEALKINEQGILYLTSLHTPGSAEEIIGDADDKGPRNPDGVLFKFLDLVPYFRSPELQQLVAESYPIQDKSPETVNKILDRALDVKQVQIRQREMVSKTFTYLTFAAVGLSIGVESRFLQAFLGISTAVSLIVEFLPEHLYRKNIKHLAESLFLNVEPKGRGGGLFDIDESDLEEVTILERDQARQLYGLLAFSLAADAWFIRRYVAEPLQIQIIRTWRGVTRSGHVVVGTREMFQLQENLMKLMAVVKKEFPESWDKLRVSGHARTFRDKVLTFMSEKTWKANFPEVYERLKTELGLTADLNQEQLAVAIRKINAEKGLNIPEDALLWEIAEDVGFVNRKLLSSQSISKILRAEEPERPKAARAYLERNVERKLSNLQRDLEDELKFYRNEGATAADLGKIAKNKHHVEVMQLVSNDLKRALDIPYDDAKSVSVLNFVRRLDDSSALRTTYRGFMTIMGLPIKFLCKVVPWWAIPAEKQAIIAAKVERLGLGKWWREELNFKKPDAWIRKKGSALGLSVDKKTWTHYFQQGLTNGTLPTLIGDRWGRLNAEKQVSWTQGEWDETLLNITTGQLEAFLKTMVYTGAFTMKERMAMSAGVTLTSNALITIPQNVLKLKLYNHLNWGDTFKTFLDPDCILNITTRWALGTVFHGTYSTVRGRGTFVLRNVARNPKYGGLPDGSGMMAKTRNQVFVISGLDKTILGNWAWTRATKVLGGTGNCQPVRDPFQQDIQTTFLPPSLDEEFAEEIAARTGMKMSLSDDELKTMLAYDAELAATSKRGYRPVAPPKTIEPKIEDEFERIRRELDLPEEGS